MSSEQTYFTMFYEDDADAAWVINMRAYLHALETMNAAKVAHFGNELIKHLPRYQWVRAEGHWWGVDSTKYPDEPVTYNLWVYQLEARPTFVLEHKAWGGTY